LISSGIGVFFLRQDEPLDFLDVPTAAAAEKAKDDVRFCDGGGCNRQAAKYKLVAAVGPGKQQPGILSSKKLP